MSSKVTINTENRSQSQSYHHTSQHDFDIEESGSEKFNTKSSTHYRTSEHDLSLSRIWTRKLLQYTKALHVKPTEDPPPEPSPDYDFDDQHKHVIPFNQQVEVQVHEPLHMQYNKLKMEEVDISEKGRKKRNFK